MRDTITINQGWRFHLGECEQAGYKGYDDTGWQTVCLPHDWSVTQPFDRACASGTGYLPGGVGWYRKRFTLPQDVANRRVFLTFGGVYQNSRVWVNSYYLGNRPYGYSSFTYEITDRVSPGENVLCVRAEHLKLADSRWFTGAGIYRDVTLTLTEQGCFLPDGVFVRTLCADESEAELRVSAQTDWVDEMRAALLDAQGRPVASAQGLPQGVTLRVPKPRLWDCRTPALYTLQCEALRQGRAQDCVRIPVGIRTFRFDADQGFFLNGEPTKLKGVCLHHDAGALGAAVPPVVWQRRLEKLKAAGCNAIRFSHNPPDPALLDLCDRMGLLAIDEAFDEWEGCKNKWWQGHNVYPPKHYGYADDFPAWHEQDLAAMVRRDRNHPCVILWSIGNEVDYPNDPYVHEAFQTMVGNNDANKPAAELQYDPNKPHARRLTAVARELAAIVRRWDDTRPVSAALACPEVSNRIGLPETLDVVGYNYKEEHYAADHARYPQRILLGSENGAEPEKWLAIRDLPYIAGQFLWTGVDFLGEAVGWPIRISQAGLLDLAGFEKPSWFQRHAQARAVRTPVRGGSRRAFPRMGRNARRNAARALHDQCPSGCALAQRARNRRAGSRRRCLRYLDAAL